MRYIQNLFISVLFCSASVMAQDPGKVPVAIAGGTAGGTYNLVAQYFAATLLGSNPAKSTYETTVYQTLGSMANLEALKQDQVQVAALQGDALDAYSHLPDAALLPLRMSEPIMTEQLQMVCHRSLNVRDIDDVAKLGASAVIYVGTDQSGGYLTLNNLIKVRDSYKNIVVQTNPGTEKLSPMKNAIEMAASTSSCAAWVSKAPDKYVVDNIDRLYKVLNLVDLYDRYAKSYKDQKGQQIYTFREYSEILPAEDNPYIKLRQGDPDATGWASSYQTFDPYTIEIPAYLVVNEQWESDLIGTFKAAGKQGQIDIWNNAFKNVVALQGNFSRVMPLISKIPVQQLQ